MNNNLKPLELDKLPRSNDDDWFFVVKFDTSSISSVMDQYASLVGKPVILNADLKNVVGQIISIGRLATNVAAIARFDRDQCKLHGVSLPVLMSACDKLLQLEYRGVDSGNGKRQARLFTAASIPLARSLSEVASDKEPHKPIDAGTLPFRFDRFTRVTGLVGGRPVTNPRNTKAPPPPISELEKR